LLSSPITLPIYGHSAILILGDFKPFSQDLITIPVLSQLLCCMNVPDQRQPSRTQSSLKDKSTDWM
jgi:hypothetical protein